MDHAARSRRAEERVSGGLLSRKLLPRVPRLAWGEGRDTTLAGALAASLRGEDVYDAIMAGSGVAFDLRVDDRWDPGTVSPHGADVVARAARVAGLRADVVEPPLDDELRELVWERLAESLEADLAPLARGLGGLPEFGVISGYDSDGRVLFARTYADRGDQPGRISYTDTATATFVFLDRAERPKDAEVARDAVRRGAESGASTPPAFETWAAALLADVPPREAAQRAFVDHARRVFLHDARRAAARYLRAVRRYFPDRAGAELIRAAEAYAYVADEAEKHGVRPFDAGIVSRFLDAGSRRGWSHALERAVTREREAASALSSASAVVH